VGGGYPKGELTLAQS